MTAPASRQAAIEAFVADISDPANQAVVKDRWQQEWAARIAPRSPASRQSIVTKYRSAIIEKFGAEHALLDIVRALPDKVDQDGTPVLPISRAIASFVERTADMSPDDVQEAWNDEWQAHLANRPASTQSAYVSQYRNAIKKAYGAPAWLPLIRTLQRENLPPVEERTRSTERRNYGGRKPGQSLRYEHFIADLQALYAPGERRGKKAAEAKAAMIQKIEDRWQEELNHISPLAQTTQLRYIASYREAISSAFGDAAAPLHEIVRAPLELSSAVASAQTNRIIDQHVDLVAIENWQDIVDLGRSLLFEPRSGIRNREKEIAQVAASLTRQAGIDAGLGLTIVTGRRPYEVFVQGHAVLVPLANGHGYEKWSVMFDGQAKTRAREGTRFDQAFAIPVLAPAATIAFTWDVLRASRLGQTCAVMTYEEFSADVLRRELRQRRADLLGPLWPLPSPEDGPMAGESKKLKQNNIRALYAEIAYHFFKTGRMSYPAFFAKALGHTTKDIETANHYMKYHLPDLGRASTVSQVKKRLARAAADAADQRAAIAVLDDEDAD